MNDGSFLVVDPTVESAPYLQIALQVRAAIERGELRPGDVVPTVRQLAGDLGIAPNTVARAYAELQRDGWLTSDGRRGTRVASQLPQGDAERAKTLHETVQKFVNGLRLRGFTAQEIVREVGRVTEPAT